MISLRKIALIFFLSVTVFLKGQSRIYGFQAVPLTDSVRLSFTVLQGSVCAGWQIYKGSDSINLNPIYSYPGLCGDVNFAIKYSYTDFGPNRVTPNYYKVVIPPSDNSPVIRVDIASSFSNLLIYPQPVEDYLNIAISQHKNYNFEIHIYDRDGIKRGFGSGSAAEKITLNVSSLIEGVYPFYIVIGDGSVFRGKFVKKPNY